VTEPKREKAGVDGRKEGRKEYFRGRGSNRIPQNNRLSFAYAPDN